jgi:hypothetical protein
MLHPPRASADGRQGEAVVTEDLAELFDSDRLRPGREDLNRVETEGLRLAASRRQVVPEDERPPAGFLDEADGHGRADHGAKLLSRRRRRP